MATAEEGNGETVAVLSGAASVVGAALPAVGGVASVAVVVEDSAAGSAAARGGTGDVTVAVAVSALAASAAGSGTTVGLTGSTGGSAAGSFSGGGVGSEGCGGILGASELPGAIARILLKDNAGAAALDGGTGKVGLEFDSGGLNKLPEAASLDKSVPAKFFTAAWKIAPKLSCDAPLVSASPGSTKGNEAAVGLADVSLASSPWPTRSPEKLPRVSPPASFEGCGSTLRTVVEGLSPEEFGAAEDAAEATDSSMVWPKSILPFPKENLCASFTREKCRKKQKEEFDTSLQRPGISNFIYLLQFFTL